VRIEKPPTNHGWKGTVASGVREKLLFFCVAVNLVA